MSLLTEYKEEMQGFYNLCESISDYDLTTLTEEETSFLLDDLTQQYQIQVRRLDAILEIASDNYERELLEAEKKRKTRSGQMPSTKKAWTTRAGEKQAAHAKSAKGSAKFADVDAAVGNQKGKLRSAYQGATSKLKGAATSPAGKKAAIVTVVAAAGAAGYQVYKNKMSKAARACSGKKGVDKNQCMVTFKRQALLAQAAKLQASMAKCDGTRDPVKCKAKIQSRIEQIKSKASTD